MYKNINEIVLKSVQIVKLNRINNFATAYQTTSTTQTTQATKKATTTQSTVNKINKQVAEAQNNQTDFFTLVRNNKLLILFVIFAVSNVVYFLKPIHIRRPEILARNRTERPSDEIKQTK